ncbi:MAG: glycosyltransferase family 2 protein [Halioglobus sp.]|nr:glycosyltransferase family 2 protein [Halioglobus sp.]
MSRLGRLFISEPARNSIAVCICTFRRPEGLKRLLKALHKQSFKATPTPAIFLIIVDNSPSAESAPICDTKQWILPVTYLHEPRPGISYARNAALAAVPEGTDFIAMTDDDAVPESNWLDQLLSAQSRSQADVVVGPTIPRFPPGTPAWVAATGFFLKPQNQKDLRALDPDPPAATCNVLLRAELLGESRLMFDPTLAMSGGEDKLLFQLLKSQGRHFAWAPTARAIEWISGDRANFNYMWRESYRRGLVKFFVKRKTKSRSTAHSLRIALRLNLHSIIFIPYDAFRIVITLSHGRETWVPIALNIARNLGVVAGVMGVSSKHYRLERNEC